MPVWNIEQLEQRSQLALKRWPVRKFRCADQTKPGPVTLSGGRARTSLSDQQTGAPNVHLGN